MIWMKQPLGIYLVSLALLLTWPLHIGAGAFVLAEFVGNWVAPNQDLVLLLFGLPAFLFGGVFAIALITGIFCRYRWALYGAALLFLAGLGTVFHYSPRPSLDWMFHIYDWLLCIALTLLSLISALYLCWIARHRRNQTRILTAE